MTLDQYIKDQGLTDKGFGDLISRSRLQVYRYRHGMQIPSKKAMERIIEKTNGQVQPSSFYQQGNGA